MAKQRKAKRNTLPRKSSPKGVEARQERRVATFKPIVMKGGGSGGTKCHKPGSRNHRKVGR